MSVWRVRSIVISALVSATSAASAMPIESGADVPLDWDNTIQATVLDQRSGLMSTRLDWLSQVSLSYRDVGLQVSSAAWYDPTYASWRNQGKGIGGGGTYPTGDIELFDAFIHGAATLDGDQPVSFRLGRQVTLWGESLYFVGNGLAAGQAPIDSYRYQTGGYDQANQALLPVGQGVFSWQPTNWLTLMGYYQFEWRPSRINPYDAYDSTVSVLGDPYTRQIVLPGRDGHPVIYDRASDVTPGSHDQFGLGLRGHQGDFDWGLYGLSFNAKTPELYYYPAMLSDHAGIGHYARVYPKGIETYGVSVTGPLGDGSFGAEISARRKMPLVNAGIVLLPQSGVPADNGSHPRYPIGDTLHAQFSWIYATPPLPGIPGGANLTGEVAANDLLAATANADQLVPGRTHAAAAVRTVFEPQFFQIWPRFDLTVPVGLGYNFLGRSETDSTMNRGTADLTIGAKLTFDRNWKFAINATHYFGNTQNAYLPYGSTGMQRQLSYWDVLNLSVECSF